MDSLGRSVRTTGYTWGQLEPSYTTATVTAVSTRSNSQTFTLGTLPSFFTNAGIMSIQVDVFSTAPSETEEDQMVSSLSSFKTGGTVSVRGLLFNTMTTPNYSRGKGC